MDGMREFDGPDLMMFGPDSKMMRERLEPLMKERIEPLLRQFNSLPRRIQIRTPVRSRTVAPIRIQRTYRV
jgi:hypothetical protein